MSAPQRYGVTFPFDGMPLLEQRELVRELVDLGYTDLWSAESGGYDAFIPLAAGLSRQDIDNLAAFYASQPSVLVTRR